MNAALEGLSPEQLTPVPHACGPYTHYFCSFCSLSPILDVSMPSVPFLV